MMKYLLALLLITAPTLCGELRFGPRFGVLFPGDINGVSTYPGPGLYFVAAAEFPLSSLITVEFGAGVQAAPIIDFGFVCFFPNPAICGVW